MKLICQSLFLITTNNLKNLLGKGHQDFGTHPKCLGPTQNAWDPNFTGHVGPRTQIEKS